MLLSSGVYRDSLAKIDYRIDKDIKLSNNLFLITGENGIGKSRFIEGVLLKELKKNNIKALYFGQDIENQILSFELIDLVKQFIANLKKSGKFLKTILLNDDSHEAIELEFNEDEILTPDSNAIRKFIISECKKYSDIDIVIFDEVDKYFDTSQDFHNFLKTLKVSNIALISHILEIKGFSKIINLKLKNNTPEVNIEVS